MKGGRQMIDINSFLPKTENVNTQPTKRDKMQNSNIQKSNGQTQDNFLSKIREYEYAQGQEKTQETNQNVTQKVGKNKSLLLDKLTYSEIDEEDDIMQNIESLFDSGIYEQQILVALTEILNIPKEEVVKIINELDIEPIQLLEQENLIEFLSILYEDTPEKQLLFDQEIVENITQIAQKLNTINEKINLDGKQILMQRIEIDDTVVATNTTVTSEEDNFSLPNMDIIKPSEYNIQSQKLGKVQIDSKEISNDRVESADVSLPLSAPKLQLGMDIPIYSIHNLESKIINNQTNDNLQHTSRLTFNIPQQIINKIEVSLLKSHQEINMELTPKELGKLSLKLSETAGVITANIKVDNEKVKELILNSLSELKTALEDQGLSVGAFNVDVRKESHYSQMERQKQKSSKRINELINKLLVEDEGQVNDNMLKETEVDYMV